MIAPVKFLCIQDFPDGRRLALYNLTESLGEHEEGATVTERTLREMGYEVPRDQQPCSECNGTMAHHDRNCTWPE